MATSDQTVNIPQLLIVLLLGGLAIRYFFFSNSAAQGSGGRNGGSGGSNGLRAREADVERIQQMFPQVARRTIMWDLQRNGGNVVATTERVLSGRGLEEPPQSFQPPLPIPSSSSTSTTTSTPNRLQQPDLISRYNLQAKLAEEKAKEKSGALEEGSRRQPGEKAWSGNKEVRQKTLAERRDEMILAARKKMEAKIAAEKAAQQGI